MSSSLFIYHNMGWDQAKKAHFRDSLTFGMAIYRSWIKTTWVIHHLYCGCSSNGLGKVSSTTSYEQDQDFPAEENHHHG